MSRYLLCTITAIAFLAASPLLAGEPKAAQKGGRLKSDCGGGCGICAKGGKGACGKGACGGGACHGGACGGIAGTWRKHHQIYEGQDPWAACGCNGSYDYPVPPLYTYHWRGIYKQRLMTDYHSPWRFPAIKPFKDEDTADVQLMQKPSKPQPATRAASNRTAKPAPIRRVSAESGLGKFFR